MGAKRRVRVINVIDTERIFFTRPYADSAGAGAGADAGADACLPMNSAIHSSEAPNEP